jgi:hypothetical protein
MPIPSNFDGSEEQYDYEKLLKSREWCEKRKEIIAKSPRCQKCGRGGRRFAVHHAYYDYGRLPWDYPDNAYMVVCNGRCHREADEDREDQQKDVENYKLYGWQWELGKKEQPPRERELRKLARYESEFKAWLTRTILGEAWDWNNEMYPLWWFWNQYSNRFLHERQHDDPQRRLAL